MKIKYHDMAIDGLELHAAEDGKMTVSGYASVFGVVNSYNEIVDKGAFIDSLKNKAVRFLFNHNSDAVIGKILECYEDDKGLYFVAEFNGNIALAKEVYSMLKEDNINGVSIGFMTLVESYIENIRHIVKVDLWEISIVTFPANEQATVEEVRSFNSCIAACDRLHNAIKQLKNIYFVN